jgi:NAD-dependent deacetylase
MRIVVFSGAGMSAESGINTFRDSGGLWEQNKIEEVASHDAWNRNPELVQNFYNQRRKQIIEAQPNTAHLLIAQMETNHQVIIVTQNIDDLHERAGSSNVIHLHGNIRFSKSSGPNSEKEYYPIDGWELRITDVCPEGFMLRPHVVWFGESVPMYDKAIEIVQSADLLILIGTSLNVYPAAGIIHYADKKARKIIIDPHVNELSIPTDFDRINAKANEGMQILIREL